jgi:integrase
MSRGSVWHLCRDRNGRPLKRERDPKTGRLPKHAANCKKGSWALAVRIPTPGDPATMHKRTGFTTQEDANRYLDRVALLLAEEPEDAGIRADIGKMIVDSPRDRLPEVRDVRRRLGAGMSPTKVPPTVNELLDDWLAAKRRWRDTTRSAVVGMCDIYLRPHLGSVRLDRLRSSHIAGMFAWIEARNEVVREARAAKLPVPPDPLDPRTLPRVLNVRNQHQLLGCISSALRFAVDVEHHIPFNPARGVELPEVPRREHAVWERDDARRFLEVAAGDRLYAGWRIVLCHGLRRGELAGLKWEDVDLDEGWLRVGRQLVYVDNRVVESIPKTDAGWRRLRLDDATVAALERHMLAQLDEVDGTHGAYENGGWVLAQEDGSFYPPKRLTVLFQRLAKRAGVSAIRLHDGRHTNASHLLASGMDLKVVSVRLGHSNTGITQNLYQHVLRDMEEAAARRAGDLYADPTTVEP